MGTAGEFKSSPPDPSLFHGRGGENTNTKCRKNCFSNSVDLWIPTVNDANDSHLLHKLHNSR